MSIEYISLGGDCATAYHLSQHGLRTQSYPFDWITTPLLTPCIKENFSRFMEGWTIKKTVVVPCIVEDWQDTEQTMYRMTNAYGFTFLHDIGIDTDINDVKEKYQRRIDRFQCMMMNPDITKHVFRMYSRHDPLEDLFQHVGYKNTVLHSIPMLTGSSWKKENHDWKTWFSIKSMN